MGQNGMLKEITLNQLKRKVNIYNKVNNSFSICFRSDNLSLLSNLYNLINNKKYKLLTDIKNKKEERYFYVLPFNEEHKTFFSFLDDIFVDMQNLCKKYKGKLQIFSKEEKTRILFGLKYNEIENLFDPFFISFVIDNDYQTTYDLLKLVGNNEEVNENVLIIEGYDPKSLNYDPEIIDFDALQSSLI